MVSHEEEMEELAARAINLETKLQEIGKQK